MPTSRVKKGLFMTFEIATKCQNVGCMMILYADSLNQPKQNIIICVTCCLFDYELTMHIEKLYLGSDAEQRN